MHEEIRSIFNSGHSCYHQVQNLMPACLIHKNINIKIHRAIILSRFLCVQNLVSHVKGSTQAQYVGEFGDEENVRTWPYKGGCNRKGQEAGSYKHVNKTSGSTKCRELLVYLRNY